MKILDKYILHEFLRVFMLTLISLMTIYIVIDFFEKIDEFVVKKAPLSDTFKYFLYKLPLINFHVTPIAILLTTVITIGLLSKYNEITIMKACGISLIRITSPILVIGLSLSILEFLNNEFIIPTSSGMANYIFKIKIRGEEDKSLVSKNNMWFSSRDRSIWNIEYFNPGEAILKGVNIYRFNKARDIKERITAPTVKWINDKWIFEDFAIRYFDGKGLIRTEVFKRKEIAFPDTIEDFKKIQKRPEEMSIVEMYEYIKKTASEGFDVTKYLVDMHYKVSFPLVSFVMSLVGIPFSLSYKRNFNLTLGIGVSIIIGFSFWIIMSIGVSLGHSGVLPPILSVWITNILYVSTGIYLLLTVRQ